MRRQDRVVVWPIYFDSTKTRKYGRRIPKSLAVPSPKISEIAQAAEKSKLKFELVSDAKYPKTPGLNTGMLFVKKNKAKSSIIKDIGRRLLRIQTAT